MGQLDDDFIERQEDDAHQRRFERVAAHYGFDPSEVDGSEVEIRKNLGNDNFDFGWYVRLPEDAPQHIKDLIGDNGFATLNNNFFEDDRDPYDDPTS